MEREVGNAIPLEIDRDRSADGQVAKFDCSIGRERIGMVNVCTAVAVGENGYLDNVGLTEPRRYNRAAVPALRIAGWLAADYRRR